MDEVFIPKNIANAKEKCTDMKKPLILVTTSNNMVENMYVVRLNHEYVNAVVQAGGIPVIVGSSFGLDELVELADGLLLTGGVDVDPALFGEEILNDTVHIDKKRDALELALIEKYWKTGKPCLAICRGLQVLNVAFGGGLVQDIPTWCGATHSAGVEHPVTVREGSLLARLTGKTELMVNSYHHQCIADGQLAAPFTPTATWTGSGVTMVEAFEQPNYPLLAVQWHPERAYLNPTGLTNMDPLFSWLVEKARG